MHFIRSWSHLAVSGFTKCKLALFLIEPSACLSSPGIVKLPHCLFETINVLCGFRTSLERICKPAAKLQQTASPLVFCCRAVSGLLQAFLAIRNIILSLSLVSMERHEKGEKSPLVSSWPFYLMLVLTWANSSFFMLCDKKPSSVFNMVF